MTKTLSEIAEDVMNDIHAHYKDFDGNQCAENAMLLSSLLASILTHEAERESACAKVKLSWIEQGRTSSESEARMKASVEYHEYAKAKALRIGVSETIRSLKARIRVKIEERREFTP